MKRRSSTPVLCRILLLLPFFPVLAISPSWGQSFVLESLVHNFPAKGFEAEIEFWKKAFSHYGRSEVVLHDRRDLRIVYEVVRFKQDPQSSWREAARQNRILNRHKQGLIRRLKALARSGSEENLAPETRRLAELLRSLGYEPSSRLYARLQKDIRGQRGAREKFRDGLVRSGKFLDHIEAIFRQAELPVELSFLPHVESSFNLAARSKAGALGMWQFMRGTGRSYLKINWIEDQRLDPIHASRAAAKLLRYNYEKLGNWPLAITAYNQGLNAMLRARKRWGPDLRRIVSNHRTRSFGFSGRNFYTQFLAAVAVSRNSQHYFPGVQTEPSWQFTPVELDQSYRIADVVAAAQVDLSRVKTYNPSLLPHVWRGGVLPSGIQLRLPKEAATKLRAGFAQLKPVPALEVAGGTYRVLPGDTLSGIASRFGTSTRVLQSVNRLPRADLIRVGQVLEIPSGWKTGQLGTHRVRLGETLSEIAKSYGTSVRTLQRLNRISNSDYIVVGRRLQVPGNRSAPDSYRVRRGDTLQRIARRFNTSTVEIQRLNRLRNANRIFPGQVLSIPGSN